jgi:hypothetical protein
MLLTANRYAVASMRALSLGRRSFTPFGRGGRVAYSDEASCGSRLANVRRMTLNEIAPGTRHALHMVLFDALVILRAYTSSASRPDLTGGVEPASWKALNFLLNTTHNIPHWLEGRDFNEVSFVAALKKCDSLLPTHLHKTWTDAYAAIARD